MCKSMNMSISNQTQGAPMATTASRKKRVVRFEEDGNRRVKRRVIELKDVPTSSDMTCEERSQRWMQRSDNISTMLDANLIVRHCQDDETNKAPNAYLHFAESYATAYNLCYAELSTDDDQDIDESNAQRGLPLDQMIRLGVSHTPSRGLEGKIMPGVGAHRQQMKREHKQGVLAAQQHFRMLGDDNQAEKLRAVSLCLSTPTQRFARALGVVDGTLALLEYASSSEEEEEEEDELLVTPPPSCVGKLNAVESCINTIVS